MGGDWTGQNFLEVNIFESHVSGPLTKALIYCLYHQCTARPPGMTRKLHNYLIEQKSAG